MTILRENIAKAKLFFAASITVFLSATGYSSPQIPGKLAPQFELRDLHGGSRSLSSYRGKMILINFWATWCVPCLKEIPDLIRLQRSIKSPFTVIGIAVASGEPDDIEQFARDHGMNYPILLDPHQRAYQKFRLIGLPGSFLVDRSGRVVKGYVGPQKYEKFMDDIRSILNRKGG